MIKRRRGVVLKLLALLVVTWLLGIAYVASGFFSSTSVEQVVEKEVSSRENRGVDGIRHTAFNPGFVRLDGLDGKSESAVDKDSQLLHQFKMDQQHMNQLLNSHTSVGTQSVWHDNKKQDNLTQYDPQTRSLIQLGLIIPKWNIAVESPEHSSAPGNLFD